jgi:lipopolysaccharide export system protein LptA
LRAASAQGSLVREQGKASFWPEVAVRYQEMKLRAGRMSYTETQKQLHFSQGVEAKGSEIEIFSEKAAFDLSRRLFIFEEQAEVRMYETEAER